MTAPESPRAVFDCMTFLQATTSPAGPAAACLRLVESGAVTVFVSDDILREVEDVLSRPKVRKKNPLLTDQVIRQLLGHLANTATRIQSVTTHFAYSRDPKDEPYLNLAIAVGAKYLVTRDNDLLDLMADMPEGIDFRSRFPVLSIIDPVAFLREMAKIHQASPGAKHTRE
jgi:putative PIN family toxin of toxin-antitoxin system